MSAAREGGKGAASCSQAPGAAQGHSGWAGRWKKEEETEEGMVLVH